METEKSPSKSQNYRINLIIKTIHIKCVYKNTLGYVLHMQSRKILLFMQMDVV